MGAMPIPQMEVCARSEWRGMGHGTCFCLNDTEQPPRAGRVRVYRAGWPHASMFFSDAHRPGMLRPHFRQPAPMSCAGLGGQVWWTPAMPDLVVCVRAEKMFATLCEEQLYGVSSSSAG